MKKTPFTVSCILICCLSTSSNAAALCVEATGIPAQCLYEDAASCQREATRLGGTCAFNPASPRATASNLTALYCVVESGMVATCVYPDRSSCDIEAARRQGTCVANLPEPYSEDPYKINRPYY